MPEENQPNIEALAQLYKDFFRGSNEIKTRVESHWETLLLAFISISKLTLFEIAAAYVLYDRVATEGSEQLKFIREDFVRQYTELAKKRAIDDQLPQKIIALLDNMSQNSEPMEIFTEMSEFLLPFFDSIHRFPAADEVLAPLRQSESLLKDLLDSIAKMAKSLVENHSGDRNS